jgi:hypothetical protein
MWYLSILAPKEVQFKLFQLKKTDFTEIKDPQRAAEHLVVVSTTRMFD